jgi:uncharacterized phiE125 gp8 family phage protein
MALTITTPPTAEPVSVDDVLARLRLTGTYEDRTLIAGHIVTARDMVESATGYSVAPKSYLDTKDGFPLPHDAIKLYRPPLVSVESVQYLDDSYQWVTWDSSEYFVADGNVPALIKPRRGFTYPSPAESYGSVRIAYTVGASPYQPHIDGVLVIAAYLYENPTTAPGDAGLKQILESLQIKKVYF